MLALRLLGTSAAAIGALCGSAPAARAAVSDYVGKPVASVRLMIENREASDAMLIRLIETPVGEPLSMAAVRQTVSRLFSLGRFEGVAVDATLENGRVALRYDLQPVHPVTKIRFAGNLRAPGVDESALRRAIVDRYGATPPLGRASDMTRIIVDALGERGYLHATAQPQAEIEHAPERATLVFTIDPKERTTIGTVEIIGRPTVSRTELLSALGLATGAPFQRERLNAGIERYIEERHSQGYYEATVTPEVQLENDGRVANVTLTITAGQRVRVVFTGDPLPGDRRAELVPVQREGSVDEDLLEDSSHRIEEYFRGQGYRDAQAPHTRAEANGELVITFTLTKGALYRVSRYEVSGNASVPTAEFAPNLRLREAQPFADSTLDADASMIEEVYRRRGFAAARAQPTLRVQAPQGAAAQPPLVVDIVISVVILEGVRTTVETITFSGNTALDDGVLRGKIRTAEGGPYVRGQTDRDRGALERAYQDLGYENARVDVAPAFSVDGTRANLRFDVREGPRVFVDQVLIVGNVRTSAATIERELRVRPGDPFSPAAINESQRRLTTLGLFRRARITEVRHGSESIRDLLVTIEEAAPNTIHYGGGLEGRLLRVNTPSGGEDRVDVAPRASFQIGRRNLFGTNRSVNLFTSVSVHLQNLNDVELPPRGRVPEYRAVATFREPHLLNTAADAFISGEVQQQIRTSFNFTRSSLSAGVGKRLTPVWNVTGSYQLQRTRVFGVSVNAERELLQRLFYLGDDREPTPIRLSSVSASLIRDTRDDQVDPHAGEYVSGSMQVAGKRIGSEVGFAKSFFDARLFRALPRASRVVFAGNARLGMAGEFDPNKRIPPPERFFAGGDTTVRGFALDQLGVPNVIQNGFPIGGNGLVIFNAETRVRVGRGIQVVPFVDTGNVFAQIRDISLTELRTAVGSGIRYRSPVGPLRIDVGFKVHPLPGEGRSAWFVSFGQAF